MIIKATHCAHFNFKHVFLTQIKGPTDTSNFDDYPADDDVPPEDVTGWDRDF